MTNTALHDAVREKYASLARSGQKTGCCGPSACGCGDPVSSNLYSPDETGAVPPAAVDISLGCGNPTALVALEPGQTVLDLGSGGGIDVLLSARRVGPTGKVYGLDMTDEMLSLAHENQVKAGVTNVEFLKGSIEAIPLPNQSVDVIISNCVINLASDKDAVLRESFRVLKPGGQFAVADVVARGQIPEDVRRSTELWVGCIAGALDATEYQSKLRDAGFDEVTLEIWRSYDEHFASAFVRAQKPRTCCDSACCA